jgi:hypothetical protein
MHESAIGKMCVSFVGKTNNQTVKEIVKINTARTEFPLFILSESAFAVSTSFFNFDTSSWKKYCDKEMYLKRNREEKTRKRKEKNSHT